MEGTPKDRATVDANVNNLASSHSSSYTMSYEHASNYENFVTFVEFSADEDDKDNDDDVDSFPLSYLSSGMVQSDDVANSVNKTTPTTIATVVHCPENTTTTSVGCSSPPR